MRGGGGGVHCNVNVKFLNHCFFSPFKVLQFMVLIYLWYEIGYNFTQMYTFFSPRNNDNNVYIWGLFSVPRLIHLR